MSLHFIRVFTCLVFLMFFFGCSGSTPPVKQEPLSSKITDTPPPSKITPVLFKAPTEEERKLFTLLNSYRNRWRLPSIPLSRSLCHVAQAHIRDLHHTLPRPPCNVHSWSTHGIWQPVCYKDNHEGADRMWSKPRELTHYQGNGFEIVSWVPGHLSVDAHSAMLSWQKSSEHKAVILNQAVWSSFKWKAMGVGIYNNYAVVWFGEEGDPAGWW
jgi:hypothetical protein